MLVGFVVFVVFVVFFYFIFWKEFLECFFVWRSGPLLVTILCELCTQKFLFFFHFAFFCFSPQFSRNKK